MAKQCHKSPGRCSGARPALWALTNRRTVLQSTHSPSLNNSLAVARYPKPCRRREMTLGTNASGMALGRPGLLMVAWSGVLVSSIVSLIVDIQYFVQHPLGVKGTLRTGCEENRETNQKVSPWRHVCPVLSRQTLVRPKSILSLLTQSWREATGDILSFGQSVPRRGGERDESRLRGRLFIRGCIVSNGEKRLCWPITYSEERLT